MDTIINRFITAKRADGRAPQTIRDYKRALGLFNEIFKQLADLSRESVREYAVTIREDRGWAASTAGIHLRYVRAFLRWLALEDYTQVDYSLVIKAPKKAIRWDELLTSDEIATLIRAAGAGRFPERDQAIILFLIDTGLRRGEFMLLKRDQVRTRGERVYLQFKAPKADNKRYCILGKAAARAILAYLATRTDDDPALWYGEQGPLRYHGMYRMLRRHAKTAGIDESRVHPHAFRKTFATWWMRNGGDEQRLMALGGWNGPEMLRIYVQMGNLDDLLDGHADYSPVDCRLDVADLFGD